MTLQAPQRMSSAHIAVFRLPHVDMSTDRTILARPHRRLATAKLRREWLLQKYGNDAYRPHMTELDRGKTFTSLEQRRHKPDTSHLKTEHFEAVWGANNVWQNDIMNRQLPERIPIVRAIRIQTAPPRTMLKDTQRDATPLFQVVSGDRKTELDKQRGRTHFIDKEWPSEKISWIRLHRNASELHRRSWMQ